MENNANSDYSGNGYLKIRVTTVGGTVPASGAAVTVSDPVGEILYSLRTGRGGTTPTVMLPAPRYAESMTPGAVQPYGLYDIRIEKNGYIPVSLTDVPVFDRVTSVQSVDLLPVDSGALYPEAADGSFTLDEQGNGYPVDSSGGGRGRGNVSEDGEDGGGAQ